MLSGATLPDAAVGRNAISPTNAASTPRSRRPRRAANPQDRTHSSIDSIESLRFMSDSTSVYSPSSSARTTPVRVDGAGLPSAAMLSRTRSAGGPDIDTGNGGGSQSPPSLERSAVPTIQSIKVGDDKGPCLSPGLGERAAALTSKSGLRERPGRSTGSKQLLLNCSDTTVAVEPRKKRAKRKAVVKPEPAEIPVPPIRKPAPVDTSVPFWLTTPKDVKDIASYVKTICSRISNIEKTMKRFESERQGLLNALYQLNVRQLQESFPSRWNAAECDRLNATRPKDVEQTRPDGAELVAAATSLNGDGPGVTRGSSAGARTTVPAKESMSPKENACAAVSVANVLTDYTLPRDAKQEPTVAKAATETTASPQAESGEGVVSQNGAIQCVPDVIEIVDDGDVEEHKSHAEQAGPPEPPCKGQVDDDSESSFTDVSHHAMQRVGSSVHGNDDELEFIGESQLDRNVANYNADDFMESNVLNDFRMWRSCWLKSNDKPEAVSPSRAVMRSAGNYRCNRNEGSLSPGSEGRGVRVENASAEPQGDPLDRFWNLDFRAMSQPNMLRWARFFGIKTSNSTRSMAEELEKIRSYLSSFNVK
ncbi:hypothetical protein, conserved [Babesia bigemina]|uniref:Uncharacterized protein n=1 Tax=Babesia bigemina TaxID=5866 RepID=A0A061D1Z3_BABBI|nr:hypothetical protein, conserved [Babesia bigemina]CDR94142.1 hypothetical protein, conserved [Babesia bigemina]|eukprot:XP_012766328.1 hypothetical protein, conserved [Babesia bigemina]